MAWAVIFFTISVHEQAESNRARNILICFAFGDLQNKSSMKLKQRMYLVMKIPLNAELFLIPHFPQSAISY